jgi:hypothetical protein
VTRLAVVLAAVVASAAAYEAALATGVVELGALPGEEPAGRGLLLAAAVVSLLAGAAVCGTLARRPGADPRGAAALVAAAAAYLLARFDAYDAYYLPTLRRHAEDGLVPAPWTWLLAAAMLAAGVATLRTRAATVPAALLLPLAVATALLMGGGH